jgi:hypothetical protein
MRHILSILIIRYPTVKKTSIKSPNPCTGVSSLQPNSGPFYRRTTEIQIKLRELATRGCGRRADDATSWAGRTGASFGLKCRPILADNMDMTGEKVKPKHAPGGSRVRASTLLELVVSLTILAILVLGHSIVGYHAKLDIRRSAKRSTAAATALLLCESWAGADGVTTYDPSVDLAAQLTLTAGSGPDAPAGFTNRGSYSAVIDGVPYNATLSSEELASTLRALNVTVAWSSRDGDNPPTLDQEFPLTTYVLLD